MRAIRGGASEPAVVYFLVISFSLRPYRNPSHMILFVMDIGLNWPKPLLGFLKNSLDTYIINVTTQNEFCYFCMDHVKWDKGEGVLFLNFYLSIGY